MNDGFEDVLSWVEDPHIYLSVIYDQPLRLCVYNLASNWFCSEFFYACCTIL